MDTITSNPFPPSYTVTPTRAETVKTLSQQTRTKFKAPVCRNGVGDPNGPLGVECVRDGEQTSKRVLQVARAIEVVFLVAVIVLLVASVMLIANTIRLSIFARRREIEVMKLVGATNWFVRGPFMIEGLLCGGIGALAAVFLLLLGKELALPAILPDTFDGSGEVRALSFGLMALILLGVGLGVGAVGSGLTLRRSPARVEAFECHQRRRARPPKRPSRSQRHARASDAHRRAAVKRAEQLVEIRLPERRREPESVVAHLGPTNSGKTHHALEFLAEQGRGVYAGPLRMLAQEAHRRLSAQLGADQVGLVTGEERINDGAPIICSTVEMAPASGDVLVLDEVQWADDEERGSAWTRLLLAGEYRHIRVLGALDALPLVEHAFPQAEIRIFERKLPLEWVGERMLRSLTPGTVVVAFSRKAVLALAGEVHRLQPGRVAVLYGAMPLASRREEIDRFVAGNADVCVATDVLGHGVNLPCETLLFAETTKFDGQERRDLEPWELAQIAGRAGRFGLVERGHVGVLAGVAVGECRPRSRA